MSRRRATVGAISSAVGAISSAVGAISRSRTLLPSTLLTLLTACGTIQLDPSRPQDFDLSGTWHLVQEASDPTPSHRRLRARGGMLAFITQDFPVLRAREMRIEQSGDSMGIRYLPGGYRDVSWGTRNRGLWEVRAGWHEGNLVILSDASDARARETFTLSDGGRRLDVEVRIDARGDDLAVSRTFRRAAITPSPADRP